MQGFGPNRNNTRDGLRGRGYEDVKRKGLTSGRGKRFLKKYQEKQKFIPNKHNSTVHTEDVIDIAVQLSIVNMIT